MTTHKLERVFAEKLLVLQHPAVLHTMGELCEDIAGGTYPREWALTAQDISLVRQFAQALQHLVRQKAEIVIEPIDTTAEPGEPS